MPGVAAGIGVIDDGVGNSGARDGDAVHGAWANGGAAFGADAAAGRDGAAAGDGAAGVEDAAGREAGSVC